MTKNTAIATVADEESLALLRNQFPVDQSFTRMSFPRLGMFSQNVMSGKGKEMKVVNEAGTFYTEHQTDDVDPETGKKIWTKKEIGKEAELIVLYQRRQLKFYDGEFYTSSTVYDNDDEVIPLFKNKQEVDRGTPKELKSREIYQGKSAKGKAISKLEDNRVLFVLYKGEVYQLNLRGTSMYAFMTYSKIQSPNTVLTAINSESKENGAISWNQMTFRAVRVINDEEAHLVIDKTMEIKSNIDAEKGYFAARSVADGETEVLDLKNF